MSDSSPDNFVAVANKLYFTADDGTHCREMWAMDMQNQPPTAEAGGPYSGVEGLPISLIGSATDDDNVITAKWTASDPACTFSNPFALQTTLFCSDNGSFTITLEVRDWWNVPATDQATVTVTNAPPQNLTLSFSPSPAFLNSPVQARVQFSDSGPSDTHTATISWGEGPSQTMLINQAAHTATASHVYTAFGRYMVHVTVTDDDGAFAQVTAEITVRHADIALCLYPGSQ
jgi:hypothetical protein